jgi:hypothetical protein
MKIHQITIAVVCIGVGGFFNSTTRAASTTGFEVPWWTVDSGGGVSSGGGFEVIGTIGQPDAAPKLVGGCWSIDPGFWGAYAAVQAPGTPELHVRLISPFLVRVSFNPGCDDWVLQYASELGVAPEASIWTDDPVSELLPIGDELAREFHIPSWGPRVFFRLRKP